MFEPGNTCRGRVSYATLLKLHEATYVAQSHSWGTDSQWRLRLNCIEGQKTPHQLHCFSFCHLVLSPRIPIFPVSLWLKIHLPTTLYAHLLPFIFVSVPLQSFFHLLSLPSHLPSADCFKTKTPTTFCFFLSFDSCFARSVLPWGFLVRSCLR